MSETITAGELRKALDGMPDWTPVYASCRINLPIIGTREETVSGFDDGTPMVALCLRKEDVKALGKAL